MQRLKVNNITTEWSIDENATITKLNKCAVKMLDKCTSYPTFMLHQLGRRVRLDRVMYENFLGGTYDDDIPVFHIDNDQFNCHLDNLHVGFIPNDKYPNEIWKRYKHKVDTHIATSVDTEYWVSTYGRVYSIRTWQFMKPIFGNSFVIYCDSNEKYFVNVIDMVASTFIPNPFNKPYAMLKDPSKPLHVSNILLSYYENKYVEDISDLSDDLQELYSPDFTLENSKYWKPCIIDGFGSPYIVSMFGNFYNQKTKHLMDKAKNNDGYIIIKVSCKHMPYDGQYKSAHRLVAEMFISNPENKPEVNHKDGNKENNCVSNLEWCTKLENMRHARDNNLMKFHYDDEHPGSKLSSEFVEKLIQEYLQGTEPIVIRKKYGIPKEQMNGILRGETYKRIGEKYGLSGKTRRMKFIDSTKSLVYTELKNGNMDVKNICKILNIDYQNNRAFVIGVKNRYLKNELIV